MNDTLIRRAKVEAKRRGKSVSQMLGDFIVSLDSNKKQQKQALPPLTSSLRGIASKSKLSKEDYKIHLRKKYL